MHIKKICQSLQLLADLLGLNHDITTLFYCEYFKQMQHLLYIGISYNLLF